MKQSRHYEQQSKQKENEIEYYIQVSRKALEELNHNQEVQDLQKEVLFTFPFSDETDNNNASSWEKFNHDLSQLYHLWDKTFTWKEIKKRNYQQLLKKIEIILENICWPRAEEFKLSKNSKILKEELKQLDKIEASYKNKIQQMLFSYKVNESQCANIISIQRIQQQLSPTKNRHLSRKSQIKTQPLQKKPSSSWIQSHKNLENPKNKAVKLVRTMIIEKNIV